MDLNPKSFPILSYAMSKMPYLNGESRFDIERPRPRSRSTSEASTSTSPSFDLTEQMPLLSDPKVISSMQSTVCQVAQTRSALQLLGERPDHESVDIAKAKLAEIDSKLSKQLEEVVMTPRATIVDQHGWRLQLAKKEEEYRQAAEKEKQVYKAVITLDEMHESYEKLLKDAEEKLVKIYESAGAREESEDDQPVAEEVNEEVVRILQEASGKGNERIDLSGRRLRFLPEAFGRLPGLVALNLSTNQLEVIPDSISMLERLEELNFSANLLDSLPDSIGLLVNLKILNVSGNQLNTLPDSICHCRSLVEFDASFNRLTYLPTNIGHELVNLKKLAISLNKIRSLPTSIGEMSSLCILDVRFNELNGIPLTIGKLTNLEILNLSSNFSDLTELPDTIGDLTNLRELDLSNNQIQALPVTFGRLENLTRLNLDANPLVIPPTEVVNGGVEAVRVYMAKRLVDMLMEEEQKMMNVVKEQMESDWLTRSTSWLNDVVSGVSGSVFGYLGALGKSSIDPSLDQQL